MLRKKVLVTGASGFVGSHVLSSWTDWDVIALSNEDYDYSEHRHVVGVVVDITQVDAYSEILDNFRPEYILHLAGIATSWTKNTSLLYDVNLRGTLHLYDTIDAIPDYNPRIIYVSSAEIYGDGSGDTLINEKAPLRPLNSYASSKMAADGLSYAYAQGRGLRITIARPFPHAGPGQAEGFFVSDMASQIARLEQNGEESTLFVGNTDAVRDYLDVRDVVNAYRALFEYESQPGEIYNICSSQKYSIQELLDKLVAQAQCHLTITQDPKRMRPSNVPVSVGDNTKLREDTCWEPKIHIDTSLKDALDVWRERVSKED